MALTCPRNVGTADRALRLAGAALATALLATRTVRGPAALALALAAASLATSGVTGRCPAYVPLGIDTRR